MDKPRLNHVMRKNDHVHFPIHRRIDIKPSPAVDRRGWLLLNAPRPGAQHLFGIYATRWSEPLRPSDTELCVQLCDFSGFEKLLVWCMEYLEEYNGFIGVFMV